MKKVQNFQNVPVTPRTRTKDHVNGCSIFFSLLNFVTFLSFFITSFSCTSVELTVFDDAIL